MTGDEDSGEVSQSLLYVECRWLYIIIMHQKTLAVVRGLNYT